MKSKEEAKRLVGIFGKKLAIKCADEMINYKYPLVKKLLDIIKFNKTKLVVGNITDNWQDIKTEIKKL